MGLEEQIKRNQFFAGMRGWAITIDDALALLPDYVVVERKKLQDIIDAFKEGAEKPQDQLCLNLIYRLEQKVLGLEEKKLLGDQNK